MTEETAKALKGTIYFNTENGADRTIPMIADVAEEDRLPVLCEVCLAPIPGVWVARAWAGTIASARCADHKARDAI
jgi:hypothetical protein